MSFSTATWPSRVIGNDAVAQCRHHVAEKPVRDERLRVRRCRVRTRVCRRDIDRGCRLASVVPRLTIQADDDTCNENCVGQGVCRDAGTADYECSATCELLCIGRPDGAYLQFCGEVCSSSHWCIRSPTSHISAWWRSITGWRCRGCRRSRARPWRFEIADLTVRSRRSAVRARRSSLAAPRRASARDGVPRAFWAFVSRLAVSAAGGAAERPAGRPARRSAVGALALARSGFARACGLGGLTVVRGLGRWALAPAESS